MLVNDYSYIKGANNTEVDALLRSLVAWSAVEEVVDGVKLKETVPFGLDLVDDQPSAHSS